MVAPEPIMAGGQDWLETWRQMYDRERAQGEAAMDPAFGRSTDYWAHRAGRFAAAVRRHPQPDTSLEWLLPRLRADDTVLDIGAGTGRYLPHLARRVARVIAVEPSPAMRAELDVTVTEAGLTNVTVIASSWPIEAPPVADVALSAHVVYGVREIGPFLKGMDEAARRLCVLFVGLRHPTAALKPVWERVHGEPRLPLPAALETLCACHQLGLPARLDLVPIAGMMRYTSAEEALVDLRERLRLTPDPERDARIRAAIAEVFAPTDDGMLAPIVQQPYGGIIWWEPGTRTGATSA
ncbi:MAG: class I SAM-dependent methyltransferase [Chloroflexaceae bacterium]